MCRDICNIFEDNIRQMSFILRLIHKLNLTPVKNHRKLIFVETDKLIIKIVWKCKEPRRTTHFLKNKNKAGRLILHDLKAYYKPSIIKSAWYWHSHLIIYLWNNLSMEQCRLFIKWPTCIWLIDFWQRCIGNSIDKWKSFSTNEHVKWAHIVLNLLFLFEF